MIRYKKILSHQLKNLIFDRIDKYPDLIKTNQYSLDTTEAINNINSIINSAIHKSKTFKDLEALLSENMFSIFFKNNENSLNYKSYNSKTNVLTLHNEDINAFKKFYEHELKILKIILLTYVLEE